MSSMIFLSATTQDCSILKNNTFTYRNGSDKVLVVFSGEQHTEYHQNKKYTIKSTVRWISKCEYILTINESNLPNFPFKMGTKLFIKVNKVRGKKVYYTSSLAGRSWEGKLVKIDNFTIKEKLSQ